MFFSYLTVSSFSFNLMAIIIFIICYIANLLDTKIVNALLLHPI